jgi:integrase
MELAVHEIEALYRVAENSEFPARDAALVRAALYWGFTATELSLLEIRHVIDVDGNWRERFLLPADFAFNGMARTAWLCDEKFIPWLDRWLDERRRHGWDSQAATTRFGGFDGASRFFLNNQGRSYAMTPRAPGAEDMLPSGMHRQLRELLDAADLAHHSPQVFRDTYITRLWRKGLSRQEIMQLTGIRKAETVTRKIRHLIPEPREVFADFETTTEGVILYTATAGSRAVAARGPT